MRKFKHKETGAILIPNNKMVIKQFQDSEYYEELTDNKTIKNRSKSKDESLDLISEDNK